MANSASGESMIERVTRVLDTFSAERTVQTASEIFAAAEMQRAGLILAPRIFSTGEIIYGAKAAGVGAAAGGAKPGCTAAAYPAEAAAAPAV